MRAIVLRSTPFQERGKILTLFSFESGIVSLLIRKLGDKNNFNLPFTEPFCEAEFFYTKKNSDLLLFEEGRLLDLHLSLRNTFTYLQVASCMAQTILRSQLPGKPSPDLYLLLSSFLKQIPLFPHPSWLLSCFYLKLLKHEGVFLPEERHSFLSLEEQDLLMTLTHMQSFSKLRELPILSSLPPKIERLLHHRTKD